MKKLIASIIAIAMVLTMGAVSTLAVTAEELGTYESEVKAKYDAGECTDVYSVDITWGGLKFDYNADETWNTSDHAWLTGVNAEWTVADDSSNDINVANNSSVEVTAEFSFEALTDYTDVSGVFTSSNAAFANNAFVLPIAGEGVEAEVYTTSLMLTGSIPSTLAADYTVVGSAVITLR